MCAAQPAHEGGLLLEFPVVTPQVVGPSAESSIDFPLKVMNIYKMNLWSIVMESEPVSPQASDGALSIRIVG